MGQTQGCQNKAFGPTDPRLLPRHLEEQMEVSLTEMGNTARGEAHSLRWGTQLGEALSSLEK